MNRIFKTYKASFCILKNLNPTKVTGKLTIIPTPIGNLNDLTPNILKSLFRADLIACEDRRVAGQLYTLIKNRKIVQQIEEQFGSLGLTSLIATQEFQQETHTNSQFDAHMFYNYSNMGDKQRRRFLAKLSLEEEKKFKIEYLKYRANKILNKKEEFSFNKRQEKIDQLYGIEVSDFKYIQNQIANTRVKKNRGLLIPLNTYSETKMFELVRHLLQTKHVALVSDAGMPCISDPGWKLIDMIKKSMPTLKIDVIGGPSSVDIMLNLAKITAKGNTLTGRFEGFSSQQISNMTEESIKIDKNLNLAKEKDFSIHFINSSKLQKKVYRLEKIYGGDKKIIVTNELTKKFQRKFHGNIQELMELEANKEKEIEAKGQMSYLLYSDSKTPKKERITKENEEMEDEDLKKIKCSLNMEKVIKGLQSNTEMKSKEIAETMTTIFGLNHNVTKKLVYQSLHPKKH